MKRKRFKEKTKNILISFGNIFLILFVIAVFATITALTGKLLNYSPWSLLINDIIFIFAVYKFVNEFYYSEYSETNKKKKKFWTYFLIISILLGVIVSIGISLEHPWAILNIVALIFLFLFCLIIFIINAAKKRI